MIKPKAAKAAAPVPVLEPKPSAARLAAPGEIVMIEWDDAVASDGWAAVEDVDHLQRCFSVGTVIVEDSKRIILAGSWGRNDEGTIETNSRIIIPAGFVVSRRVISV